MLYVHTHTYIYRVFSTGGMGGDTPPTAKNLLIPLLEKFIFSRIPPPTVSIPPPPPPPPSPLSNNFQVITQ